jgi:exopolysaccharide biosynthesis polyprenyl glycosylphosphotransferase
MARVLSGPESSVLVRTDRRQASATTAIGSLRGYSTWWQVALLATDVLGFFASFFVADAIISDSLNWNNYVFLMHTAWLSIGLWIYIFSKLGMYRSSQAIKWRDEIYYIAAALSVGIVPQLILFTVVPEVRISRLLLLVAVGSAILIVGGSRATIHGLAKASDRSSSRRLLIISFDRSEQADSQHGATIPYGTSIVHRSDLISATGDSPQAILERTSWFRTAVMQECDSIVIAGLLQPSDATHVISLASRHSLKLSFAPPELCRSGYDLKLDREGPRITLVPVSLNVLSPPADFTKSLFDRIVCACALILLSPILLAIALAIRIEDGGPIFFKQERVGRNGRRFNVYKFRSMKVGAADPWNQAASVRLALTYTQAGGGGAGLRAVHAEFDKTHGEESVNAKLQSLGFTQTSAEGDSLSAHLGATRNDSRVTRVGSFIRKYSLDELAQLINILRGEMSLVGPRPWMAQYVDEFSKRIPRYMDRHLVRPGITGWAQINMHRDLTTDDTEAVLAHDLYYVENWTFLLDLSILFKTGIEFLFNRGSA